MPTVEERVQALEDERSIHETLNQYAQSLDSGSTPQALADCFTDTAVWWSSAEGPWAGMSELRLEGQAALMDWFSRVPERGGYGHRTKHFVADPQIKLRGDRATVQSYFAMIREHGDGPVVYSMGQYVDAFVRCADGRWRIDERHVERDCVHPTLSAYPQLDGPARGSGKGV